MNNLWLYIPTTCDNDCVVGLSCKELAGAVAASVTGTV